MFEITGLNIGDKLAVIYRDRRYSSVVQDMPRPDTVIIAQPTNRGVYLDIIPPDEGEILFNKENGIFFFRVTQEERLVVNGIPMLQLKAVSEVTRRQRRNYYRLDKSLSVELSIQYDDEDGPELDALKARTVNISGGGLKIAMKHPLDSGTKLECKVSFGPNQSLMLKGRVIWVQKPTNDDKTYTVGMQFIQDDPLLQKQLISFVTEEQRKQLQNNR